MPADHLGEEDRIRRCPKHIMEGRIQPCDDDVWNRIRKHYSKKNVFLNVPYVSEYEPFKLAILSTLSRLGLRPVVASDRSSGIPLRLCKICELMQTSKYCLSDLSYDSLQNMPFELGFYLGLGRQGNSLIMIDRQYVNHADKKVRKFDSRLSNLKGLDVICYEGNETELVSKLISRIEQDVPEKTIPQRISRKRLIEKILRVAEGLRAQLKTHGWVYGEIVQFLYRRAPKRSGSDLAPRGESVES